MTQMMPDALESRTISIPGDGRRLDVALSGSRWADSLAGGGADGGRKRHGGRESRDEIRRKKQSRVRLLS